jgi:hypothetical protein
MVSSFSFGGRIDWPVLGGVLQSAPKRLGDGLMVVLGDIAVDLAGALTFAIPFYSINNRVSSARGRRRGVWAAR